MSTDEKTIIISSNTDTSDGNQPSTPSPPYSPDIFEDLSPSRSLSPPKKKPKTTMTSDSSSKAYDSESIMEVEPERSFGKGSSLTDMQVRKSYEPAPVINSYNHAVLYHLPVRNGIPIPQRGKDTWDSDHVRMPFSTQNLYPANEDGANNLQSRWELIERTLLQPIHSSEELQTAMLAYNTKFKDKWNFTALHTLFNEVLQEDESEYFFQKTLPSIINLALQLPNLVPSPLPLLKQNKTRSVSLSQQQISSLLANAFLCTFPCRNTQRKQSEYNSFPDINFNRLFQSGTSTNATVIEKLKCICHYFRRVCRTVPSGVVTFTRVHIPLDRLPDWSKCNDVLGETKFHITSEGTIEDEGINMLQVDFANKIIGGGVLGMGCVQEEIRFLISPELIISRLFTEALKPNEAVIITGCEQFSKYTGYADSFMWAGDYRDDTPRDNSGRIQRSIVAIDALHFTTPQHQFIPALMKREINKAYVGFSSIVDGPLMPVATGNWGCGAFRGDTKLKALLQLIACRHAKRDLVYFTFGDIKLQNKIYGMYSYIRDNKITTAQLWRYLCEINNSPLQSTHLYAYIMQAHCDNTTSGKNESKLGSNFFQNIQATKSSTSEIREDSKSKFHSFFKKTSHINKVKNDNIVQQRTSTTEPPDSFLLTEAEIEEFVGNDDDFSLQRSFVNEPVELEKEADLKNVKPKADKKSLSDEHKGNVKLRTEKKKSLLDRLDECEDNVKPKNKTKSLLDRLDECEDNVKPKNKTKSLLDKLDECEEQVKPKNKTKSLLDEHKGNVKLRTEKNKSLLDRLDECEDNVKPKNKTKSLLDRLEECEEQVKPKSVKQKSLFDRLDRCEEQPEKKQAILDRFEGSEENVKLVESIYIPESPESEPIGLDSSSQELSDEGKMCSGILSDTSVVFVDETVRVNSKQANDTRGYIADRITRSCEINSDVKVKPDKDKRPYPQKKISDFFTVLNKK